MLSRRRAGRRHGLNRIEILVLLLAALLGLGVLVTLLVRGREASDRVQCANNLRLLGVAIHKHRETTKALPPARIADSYATWAVLIAPYTTAEKHNPLKDWQEPLPYFAQPDAVREGQFALFYCPARRFPPHNSIDGDVPADGKPEPRNYPGALGDYACVAGDGDPKRPWDGPDANGPFVIAEVLKKDGDRILKWQSRVRLEDLKRGDATLLLGDKHVPVAGRGTAAVGDGSLYNGGHPASSARVGGRGFDLAPDDSPFNNNFGSNHSGGVVQFIAVDNSLRTFTPQVRGAVIGKLMVRDLDQD